MIITGNTSINEILTQNEELDQVFQTFGIDSKAKASETLLEVCEVRNIDFSVLKECLEIVDQALY